MNIYKQRAMKRLFGDSMKKDGNYRLWGTPMAEVNKIVKLMKTAMDKITRMEQKETLRDLSPKFVSRSFEAAINDLVSEEYPVDAVNRLRRKTNDINELLSLPKYKGNKDLLNIKRIVDKILGELYSFTKKYITQHV